jgi:hypothetical protein
MANVTIESRHKGYAINTEFVEIGGIAVDRRTAKFWEDNNFLKKGTLDKAPRIIIDPVNQSIEYDE